MTKTKSYAEYYGLRRGTMLCLMVNHLRSIHRIKIGTDYWVKTNDRGIIVRPAYETTVREHLTIYVDDPDFVVQVKEKPGRKQSVYKHEES